MPHAIAPHSRHIGKSTWTLALGRHAMGAGRRLLLPACILALSGGALAGNGLPWVRTVELAPDIASPWISGNEFDVRQYHALRQTAQDRCNELRLTQAECKRADFEHWTGGAGYIGRTVKIGIESVALTISRENEPSPPLPRTATIMLMLWPRDPHVRIDPQRLAMAGCGSSARPFISTRTKIFRYVMPSPGTTWDETIVYATVVAAIDPPHFAHCRLVLTRALAEPVPDLSFHLQTDVSPQTIQ
jgi:hypothetical protein